LKLRAQVLLEKAEFVSALGGNFRGIDIGLVAVRLKQYLKITVRVSPVALKIAML